MKSRRFPLANNLVVLGLAYLLGCASTAYYLVRWHTGQDVRSQGSGNAGATNAGRVLGRRGFAIALAGDLLKGVLAVLLARWLTADAWIVALAVPAVVAGHLWPVQLGFRGGRGFATALGALLVYDPFLLLSVGVLTLAIYLLTRRRALAGAVALVTAPCTAILLGRSTAEVVMLLLLIVMMGWAFRSHLHSLVTRRKHAP